ncbi:hypothetical protein BGX38DRAFT_281276 [Terfezia claveryi]|nr:hypothetical protein BGX38DRAFT_281276 [Terfezia claveryi]
MIPIPISLDAKYCYCGNLLLYRSLILDCCFMIKFITRFRYNIQLMHQPLRRALCCGDFPQYIPTSVILTPSNRLKHACHDLREEDIVQRKIMKSEYVPYTWSEETICRKIGIINPVTIALPFMYGQSTVKESIMTSQAAKNYPTAKIATKHNRE